MLRSLILVALAVTMPGWSAAQTSSSTVVAGGFAHPIAVSSYSMYNGATGGYVYHDYLYPSDNANVDFGWLSGGTGLLTDGVGATQSWNEGAQNPPGGLQGQFVGWYMNPTIAFYFATPVVLTHMRVNYDVSYNGGVEPPASIWVNNMDYTTQLPGTNEPFWADYALPGGDGISSEAVYFRRPENAPWLMISEVQFESDFDVASPDLANFDAPVSTPEPGSLVLLGSGLAMILGCVTLRNRRSAATS